MDFCEPIGSQEEKEWVSRSSPLWMKDASSKSCYRISGSIQLLWGFCHQTNVMSLKERLTVWWKDAMDSFVLAIFPLELSVTVTFLPEGEYLSDSQRRLWPPCKILPLLITKHWPLWGGDNDEQGLDYEQRTSHWSLNSERAQSSQCWDSKPTECLEHIQFTLLQEGRGYKPSVPKVYFSPPHQVSMTS